jgi:hypothetical protein
VLFVLLLRNIPEAKYQGTAWQHSIPAVKQLFKEAKVVKLFQTCSRTIGHPNAGGYDHMHFVFPEGMQCVLDSGSANTTDEDCRLLERIIERNLKRKESVEKAYDLLTGEKVVRDFRRFDFYPWIYKLVSFDEY